MAVLNKRYTSVQAVGSSLGVTGCATAAFGSTDGGFLRDIRAFSVRPEDLSRRGSGADAINAGATSVSSTWRSSRLTRFPWQSR